MDTSSVDIKFLKRLNQTGFPEIVGGALVSLNEQERFMQVLVLGVSTRYTSSGYEKVIFERL